MQAERCAPRREPAIRFFASSHQLHQLAPRTRILYLSCETFVNHFISALETGNLTKFRDKYRNVNVLVVDDIHLLANKEKTQEEFFHTFNTLYNAGAQIVLSSDSPPIEIPTLQERLVSRFSWGLVTLLETMRLLGEHRDGTFAEFVALPARNALPVPAAVLRNASSLAPDSSACRFRVRSSRLAADMACSDSRSASEASVRISSASASFFCIAEMRSRSSGRMPGPVSAIQSREPSSRTWRGLKPAARTLSAICFESASLGVASSMSAKPPVEKARRRFSDAAAWV